MTFKKTLSKLLGVAAFLAPLAAVSAHAADWGWSDQNRHITMLWFNASGNVGVMVDGSALPSDYGEYCSGGLGLSLDQTHSDYNTQVSALMTAFAQQRPIALYYDKSQTCWFQLQDFQVR